MSALSPPLIRPAARYDAVARCFHWAMAACFLVVFVAAAAHFLVPDTALENALWPVHKPVGALLMLLVVLRAGWALLQRDRRPPSTSRAARWGHLALYGLMVAIPAIGLLRQWGSARAFEPFGLPLMSERPGEKVEWMVELGGLLHGELGWLLLALIVGHVAMVVRHRRRGEDVLHRMT